jgi:prepilin-type N-terminal cleavage/methylation domain-containing protein/prepilin-type processing-associated H-X9-DG protein
MRHVLRRGFTLVELLIVIGIVVLLLAILLPALSKARQQAWQVQCASNERQILLAVFMYADSNRGVLPLPAVNTNYAGQSNEMIGMITDGQYDYRNGALWPFVGTKDPMGRERLFTCPADPEPRIWINGLSHGSPRNFSYNFNWEISVDPSHQYPNNYGVGVHLSRAKGSEHKIIVVEEKAPWYVASIDVWEFMVSDPAYWMPPASDQPWSEGLSPFASRHNHYGNMGMADGHVELLGPNDLLGATDLPIATVVQTHPGAHAIPSPKYGYYFQLPHF